MVEKLIEGHLYRFTAPLNWGDLPGVKKGDIVRITKVHNNQAYGQCGYFVKDGISYSLIYDALKYLEEVDVDEVFELTKF